MHILIRSLLLIFSICQAITVWQVPVKHDQYDENYLVLGHYNGQLGMMNAEGSRFWPISDQVLADASSSLWLPEQQKLLYWRDRYELWSSSLLGHHQRRVLKTSKITNYRFFPSPDGQRVAIPYVAEDSETGYFIIEGEHILEVATGDMSGSMSIPFWHGNALYFATDIYGAPQIFRFDLATMQQNYIADGSFSPAASCSIGLLFENNEQWFYYDFQTAEITLLRFDAPAKCLANGWLIGVMNDRIGGYNLATEEPRFQFLFPESDGYVTAFEPDGTAIYVVDADDELYRVALDDLSRELIIRDYIFMVGPLRGGVAPFIEPAIIVTGNRDVVRVEDGQATAFYAFGADMSRQSMLSPNREWLIIQREDWSGYRVNTNSAAVETFPAGFSPFAIIPLPVHNWHPPYFLWGAVVTGIIAAFLL